MKKMLIAAILVVSTNGIAAVSAYYDSMEKIQTVLASYPLSRVTAGPITNIKETDKLTYKVVAGNCSVLVSLEAHPPGMPGKTTYTVQGMSQPSCQ